MQMIYAVEVCLGIKELNSFSFVSSLIGYIFKIENRKIYIF